MEADFIAYIYCSESVHAGDDAIVPISMPAGNSIHNRSSHNVMQLSSAHVALLYPQASHRI
jgi:hypothetical protein